MYVFAVGMDIATTRNADLAASSAKAHFAFDAMISAHVSTVTSFSAQIVPVHHAANAGQRNVVTVLVRIFSTAATLAVTVSAANATLHVRLVAAPAARPSVASVISQEVLPFSSLATSVTRDVAAIVLVERVAHVIRLAAVNVLTR